MNSNNVAPQVYNMSDIARLSDFFSAADKFFAEKTNQDLLHSAQDLLHLLQDLLHSVLVACCLTTLNGIFALQSFPVFSDGLAD